MLLITVLIVLEPHQYFILLLLICMIRCYLGLLSCIESYIR